MATTHPHGSSPKTRLAVHHIPRTPTRTRQAATPRRDPQPRTQNPHRRRNRTPNQKRTRKLAHPSSPQPRTQNSNPPTAAENTLHPKTGQIPFPTSDQPCIQPSHPRSSTKTIADAPHRTIRHSNRLNPTHTLSACNTCPATCRSLRIANAPIYKCQSPIPIPGSPLPA